MARRLVVPAVAAVLLGVAGCGGARVTASDVETAVADQVESQVGTRPTVSCPDDLPAEVGATARCTLSLEGVPDEYGVTVEVTDVEEDQARFDIQVDEEPLG